MKSVTKYESINGVLFNSEQECLDYEESLVDKNGQKIKLGDIVMMSWNGGGWMGSSEGFFSAQPFYHEERSFKFITFCAGEKLEAPNLMHRDLTTEVISDEKVKELSSDSKYIFDDYNKYFRVRQKWDK